MPKFALIVFLRGNVATNGVSWGSLLAIILMVLNKSLSIKVKFVWDNHHSSCITKLKEHIQTSLQNPYE